MGLDIYFHKTKVETANKSYKDIISEDETLFKENLKKVYDKVVKALDSVKDTDYDAEYLRQIKKLSKMVNYPQYIFKELGVGYNYNKSGLEFTSKPVSVFKNKEKEIIDRAYPKYDAYFRKVNFLFSYFDKNGTLVDGVFSEVTRSDLRDIIERCNEVIERRSVASSLLPTQDGFFFGSTDYDDWYYNDVKECKKSLSKFLKGMGENDNAYVVFSW